MDMRTNHAEMIDGLPARERDERFTYTTRGLASRDELLLKSVIRLLDHKTRHRWTYTDDAADLVVLGADVVTDDTGRQAGSGAYHLRLGYMHKQEANFLQLPLRPQELEHMLNMVGDRIAQSRRVPAPAAADSMNPHAQFRLLKWPSVDLLGTPERVKLTTMLARRPQSLAGLMQHTGCSQQLCAAFCDELRACGLLQISGGDTDAAPAPHSQQAGREASASRLDILSRIRLRLGLVLPVPR